jgi:hypothetical protein
MQVIPGEFETAIKRGYAIEGKSIVVAEWNYNKIFNVTVTNPPDDQNWILNKEYFTPQSVVSGFRPSSGIFYGITDEALTDGSTTGLDANRYYTIDSINKYKYWVCPTPSVTNPPGTDVGSIVDTVFTVDRGTLLLDYGQFLNMNKITATFNLGPMPNDWSLWVFEQTANDWVEINNPTINEITGKAEIWWNGTAWVEEQQLNETIYQHISKVKLEVRSLAEPNKRLQVVEVSGRREVDMTERTEEYSINASMDAQDFIFPVGRMSANDGSITFNNTDLKMNHQNPTSDFYGALVGWCQYRTYVKYDLTPYGGAEEYNVKTATMYANDFQQANEWEYTVELFDVLKILQTIDCPALLIEQQSLARVIATLLDMVGVDTYSFEFEDWDKTNLVKYFWTDGTEKVFDVLSRLVQSFQAALFVDEDGIIRLITRNDYTPQVGDEPVWTFRGAKEGLDLPDVIKLDKKYALQVNKVNVKYTKRQVKIDDLDITEQPLTSTIWEGSDAIVLRGSPLTRALLAEDLSAIPYRIMDGLSTFIPKNCTFTLSSDHPSPAQLGAGRSGKIQPIGTPVNTGIESGMVNTSSIGKMHAHCYVWMTSNVVTNFSASVNWYDANKQLMSTSSNWVSVTAGSWKKVENTFTIPDGAKYCSLVPTLRNSPQTFYIDLTQIYPDGFEDNWDIWVSSSRAETWPYSGKVNIDGEIIEYAGKSYAWWDFTDGYPTYMEAMVFNNDERKAYDRKSYQSWVAASQDPANPIVGGVSTDPTKQNHFVGRLRPKTRDFDQSGQRKFHPNNQGLGWYTMDFWTAKSNSWGFPGKYFTPGGNKYNIDNLMDWNKRVNWTECQGRVKVNESVATIDNVTNNTAPDHATHATVLVKNHGDTEFREIGTRLRIRGGTKGRAMIPFYMTNAVGYDNVNPPITEVFDATRCYIVNVSTSEYCDSVDRSLNEISVQYKNGDQLLKVYSGGQGGNAGKLQLDADKWYDIDIIFRDGQGEILEGGGFYGARPAIEVYIDGAYTDTWYPASEWSIRPTSLIGLGAKDTTIVDFEYLYGSTTTNKGRFVYPDRLFDANTLQLPAGDNVERSIELPIGNDWLGSGVISFATWGASATITDLRVQQYNSKNQVILSGTTGLSLKPNQRMTFELDDILPLHGILKIKYTATNPISLCMEFSQSRVFEYGIDNEPVPPSESFYDRIKSGYFSSKFEDTMYTPQKYSGTQFTSHNVTNPIFLNYFYEDFGSIVHEIRDFNVDLDTSPAKGISVYSSNQNSKVIDFKYNPVKGIFTLVNTSHRDEIVNGTEQIDDSNSIDQTLLLYGYVLEDKGEDTETVTNDLSILRHGIIAQDLDASWIFSKEEAQALGKWITDHWADSMDVILLDTFCSTFIQIGDKVNIYYPNANIDESWMFVVTDKSTVFGAGGLTTSVTVRRVR